MNSNRPIAVLLSINPLAAIPSEARMDVKGRAAFKAGAIDEDAQQPLHLPLARLAQPLTSIRRSVRLAAGVNATASHPLHEHL